MRNPEGRSLASPGRPHPMLGAPLAATFVTDTAGVIAGWGASATAVFGLPASQVIGHGLASLVAAEDATEVGRLVAEPTGLASGRLTLVAGDGTRLAALVAAIRSGQTVRWFATEAGGVGSDFMATAADALDASALQLEAALVLEETLLGLAETTTMAELQRRIMAESRSAVGARGATLVMHDGDELAVVAHDGFEPELIERFHRFPLTADIPAATAARSGAPVFVGSRGERDERFPILEASGGATTEALAALPLRVHDTVVAVVGYVWDEPVHFGHNERRRLLVLAAHISAALERARTRSANQDAFAAQARLGARLRRLTELTAEMAAAPEPDLVLVRVANGVATLIGCGAVEVIVDDDAARAEWGDLRAGHGPPIEPDDAQLLVSIPLPRAFGGVLGSIRCAALASDSAAAEDERLLQLLARQVGSRIEALRALAAEQRARAAAEVERERLTILANLTQVLAATLDPARVIDDAAHVLVPRAADWVSIWLPDGPMLRRATVAHHGSEGEEQAARELVASQHLPIGSDHPIAVTYRKNEARRLTASDDEAASVLAEDHRLRDLLASLTHQSVVAAPVVAHGSPIGVLTMRSSGRIPAEEDLTLAVEAGARIGAAYRNALRSHRDHVVADALVEAVLPDRLPDVSGLEMAAIYQPASPGIGVGGDWYDVFALPEGAVGVVVADVSGHGVSAAATMASLRNGLRVLAADGGEPGEVVARLNNYASSSAMTDMCTLQYGVIDAGRSTLTLCTAGHPPPVRLVGGRADVLAVKPDAPLGLDSNRPYRSASFPLARGTTLFFYTDGLVERRGEIIDRGIERLRDLVEREGARRVYDLVPTVVDRACGTARRGDDVCAVAVRVLDDPTS